MSDDEKDKEALERENKAADELEAEIEDREDSDEAGDRAVLEDLNQGMDTGTHDSIRRGVNWPASYRVKPTPPDATDPKKDPNSKG